MSPPYLVSLLGAQAEKEPPEALLEGAGGKVTESERAEETQHAKGES